MFCWKYAKLNSRNTYGVDCGSATVGLLLGSQIPEMDYPNCIVI